MSDNEFQQTLRKQLWADFDEEMSFPERRPLLAHYTSIATFEKIVTVGELWFSNPLYMNDLEELRFGLNEGVAEFMRSQELAAACGTSERHNKLLDAFQFFFRDFDEKHVLNTYIVCFSEHQKDDHDGLLSMWRGYGGGGAGVALVIDTEKFESIPASPLIVGNVHYATRAERLDWIRDKITILAELIRQHFGSNDDLVYAAWAWLYRLKTFALFTKHLGFHEEKEWRIVYMSERDQEGKLKPFYSHFVTNRGIEPKLKVPIKPLDGITAADLSLEKIVDRIVLGPSISSVLAANSIRQMLRNIGRETLAERVFSSEIPFRPAG